MHRSAFPLATVSVALLIGITTSAHAQRPLPVDRAQPAPRVVPRTVATPSGPTRSDTVSEAWRLGASMPGRTADANLIHRWTKAAMTSGFTRDELVAAWTEIMYSAVAYDVLLGRTPTPDELRRRIGELRGGREWRALWKELATSDERDRKYGYYAPAPLAREEVTRLYGIPQDLVNAGGEHCFGATGPNCDMPKPLETFVWTYPRWQGHFRLPDGTEMAYVRVGVTVGSVLHDNMCLQVMPVIGNYCGVTLGTVVGDFVKNPGTPVAMEWNKAFYNVRDRRGWNEVFGPYPVDRAARNGWYDDLRPVEARPARMAPVLGMLTVPILSEAYKGPERRGSRRLEAPSGTKVDQTDVAYCKSKAFSATSAPPLFAPEGTCR